MKTFDAVLLIDENDEMVSIDLDNVTFDETVVKIDAWYDVHTKLWIIQKLNKDDFQVGDAIIVHGKKDAMRVKKELEAEYNI